MAAKLARLPWQDHPERWVLATLVLVLGSYSAYCHSFPHFAEARQHLGAEYFNIGQALADGRGFSDPFGERTGPTAWMPPLYPSLLGALIALCKTRAVVGVVVAALMAVTCVVNGFSMYLMARACAVRVSPLIGLALFLIWVWAFNFWLLIMSTDVWLLALVSNLLCWQVFDYVRTKKMRPIIWGVTGGLATLSSPTLAGTALALFVLFLLLSRKDYRTWLKTLAIAVVIAAPWPLRNALVFHRFIPVKSNAYFEVFQANFVDDDGIYDSVNLHKHPYHMLLSRFRYASLGEMPFLDERRMAVRSLLKTEMPRLVHNTLNRAVGTVIYPPLSVEHETSEELAIRRVIYAAPLTLWLLAVFRRGPHRKLLFALGFLTTTYLFPYVLIAFYIRYYLIVTPVLLLTMFIAIDHLAASFLPRRQTAGLRPAAAE